MVYLIFISVLVVISVIYFRSKIKQFERIAYLTSYKLPDALAGKLKDKYPHLTDDQVKMVLDALSDYFYICNQAKKRMVSMPSQVVDMAWHEFILFTRAYEVFCKKALGRFLHHTPTEAMATPTLAHEGIKRAWRLTCAKESIHPSKPNRLPLLFAIDGLLNIEDGFRYSLNCQDKTSPLYGDGFCAGHIGCAAGCAGDSASASENSGDSQGGFFDGFGGSDGDSGGGDGCGGGGCGGN